MTNLMATDATSVLLRQMLGAVAQYDRTKIVAKQRKRRAQTGREKQITRRRTRAFSKALLRGNAYAYKELSALAYGKLREIHQHEFHPYKDMSEEDMLKRIAEIEQKLGVPVRAGAERLVAWL